MFRNILAGLLATTLEFAAASVTNTTAPLFKDALRIENHINTGTAFDMVTSLIIGSEAAIIVDMPMTVPQAKELAAWIKNTTDKPIVAAFTTHFHPDHYLSAGAVLEEFPGIQYYANSKAVALIKNEAAQQVSPFPLSHALKLIFKVAHWSAIFGNDAVVQNTTIPAPYDYTFFTLPGDENSPIHLLSPLGGDGPDETLFWIPAIGTLIAGDTVYSASIHIWLADLRTPALTASWLASLDFIASLAPVKIIPGHALDTNFLAADNWNHTKTYVEFYQERIQSVPQDTYSPSEITGLLDGAFPGLLNSSTSATLLNITAEHFGRGGVKQARYVDLESYDDIKALDGWKF